MMHIFPDVPFLSVRNDPVAERDLVQAGSSSFYCCCDAVYHLSVLIKWGIFSRVLPHIVLNIYYCDC